jgi:hypothetical protein
MHHPITISHGTDDGAAAADSINSEIPTASDLGSNLDPATPRSDHRHHEEAPIRKAKTLHAS